MKWKHSSKNTSKLYFSTVPYRRRSRCPRGGAAASVLCSLVLFFLVQFLWVYYAFCGLHTSRPAIHLANVRSLVNKMDELMLLNHNNSDFHRSAALFHGNLALWTHPGQRTSAAWFPTHPGGPQHRALRENERPWKLLLFKRRLVYRCYSAEKDVQP